MQGTAKPKGFAKIWREIKRLFREKNSSRKEKFEVSPEWILAQERISKSQNMVDLGCGASPHKHAKVGVDWFVEPEHRALGTGKRIDPDEMLKHGVKFVHASLESLPFSDKEFDFSYSHHVIEHVEHPHLACEEIMRISREGVIICPSAFAETAFGRPYHLWQVHTRGNTLIFIRKRKIDNCPFGKTPVPYSQGKMIADQETNPFDILLNDGYWYHGSESMHRLSKKLRHLWYSHSPVVEVVFNWSEKFNYIIIDENGNIIQNYH